ncbi:MAG: PD-(D/E)XK nuclease family protein [Deltaproteobacteria bacterium]|nr:PD-(D/E)XK nuclease family protein [Deltaproteobacteria bacterium]
MSETIKWSFSTDRCIRRCQRQYFLQHVAAWHNARDPVRREAFLLKQVKTLNLWQGSLVHRGIELFIVPALQQGRRIEWDAAIVSTEAMAKRQFAFSKARRYREKGMSKVKAKDDYCALAGHEIEAGVSPEEFQGVLHTVEQSLRNLASMTELLEEIQCVEKYWPELPLYVGYDIARIEVHIDLLYFRAFAQPTIIDWKVSRSMGGSETDLQTALYAWAMCRHPKWRVERPEDCELIEVQLLTQNVIRHQVTKDIFDRLENRIYRSLSMIQSVRLGRSYNLADLDDYDFAKNPNSCSYCPQGALCRRLADSNGLEMPKVKAETPHRAREDQTYVNAYPQLF